MRPPYNILLEINADLNQGRYLDDNILDDLIESRGEWVLGEIVFLLNAELREGNFLQIATDDQHAQISARRVPLTEQQENELKALVNKLVVDGLGSEIINRASVASGVSRTRWARCAWNGRKESMSTSTVHSPEC